MNEEGVMLDREEVVLSTGAAIELAHRLFTSVCFLYDRRGVVVPCLRVDTVQPPQEWHEYRCADGSYKIFLDDRMYHMYWPAGSTYPVSIHYSGAVFFSVNPVYAHYGDLEFTGIDLQRLIELVEVFS